MRGRPSVFQTDEERNEARRQAGRKYRKKRTEALETALLHVKELENKVTDLVNENRVLRTLNGQSSTRFDGKVRTAEGDDRNGGVAPSIPGSLT
jgi:hypothetical protein